MTGPWKCPACDEGFVSWDLLLHHASTLGHTAYTRLRGQHRVVSTPPEQKNHAYNETNSNSSCSAQGVTSTPAAASEATPTATTTLPSSLAEPNPLGATQPLGTQHPPEVPRWSCSICNLSFPLAIALDAHYRASLIHPQCGACGKCCLDKGELSTHLQVAHASTLCICGVQVKIADLQEHYKTSPCHPICPICGIGVKDARDLHELHSSSEAAVQHQREAHADARQGGGVLAEDKVIGDVELVTVGTSREPSERISSSTLPAETVRAPVIPAVATGHPAKTMVLAAEVRNEAQPDASLDASSSIHLEVKITPSEKAEAGHPPRPPAEGTSRCDREVSTDSEEMDHLQDVPRESVHVAVQVDPQPVGQRPESVLSYVTDLELVSSDDQVATASASAQATSSFSMCSTKDMMTESDGMGLGAPDRLSRSGIAESETCPVPQSDACTLGQSTRSPSPSGSSGTSSESAPRRPNDTPPPLHAPRTFSGQRSAPSWASTSCNPVSTRSENLQRQSAAAATGRSAYTSDASTSNAPPVPTERAAGPSWHCRSCGKEPCDNPTATVCGHIFCYRCIVREIAENMQCPVCRKTFLLKLHVD